MEIPQILGAVLEKNGSNSPYSFYENNLLTPEEKNHNKINFKKSCKQQNKQIIKTHGSPTKQERGWVL